MRIGKTYEFHASHRLPNHNGKCRRQHGHSYVLEVEVWGYPKEEKGESDDGMVMDYAELDMMIDPVIEQVDHYDFNKDIAAFGEEYPPTAENIVSWIVDNLHISFPKVKFSRVRLWETRRCYAEWVLEE